MQYYSARHQQQNTECSRCSDLRLSACLEEEDQNSLKTDSTVHRITRAPLRTKWLERLLMFLDSEGVVSIQSAITQASSTPILV
jgi:hypothetical protein